MGDVDKNGNYCENKVSNHKWIWNTTTYDKPKSTWPIKDSTGEQKQTMIWKIDLRLFNRRRDGGCWLSAQRSRTWGCTSAGRSRQSLILKNKNCDLKTHRRKADYDRKKETLSYFSDSKFSSVEKMYWDLKLKIGIYHNLTQPYLFCKTVTNHLSSTALSLTRG